MPPKLLISLPVHECRRVVEDQLRNLRYFLREPQVVLHVSQNYREDPDFSSFPGVFVNPQRLPTKWGNINYLHYVNVDYAFRLGLDFDVFVHAASNEMYVRAGLEDYLAAASAAFDRRGLLGPDDEFPPLNAFLMKAGYGPIRRSKLPELCARTGTSICQAPIEGSAYRRDVLRRMLDVVDAELGGLEGLIQGRGATEESLFPTLFLAVCTPEERAAVKPHTCFMDWRYEIGRKQWQCIIRHIAGRDPQSAVARYLQGVDAPPEPFSVKRIPRTYFDPLRTLIRDELMEGYPLSDDRIVEYQAADRNYLRAELRANLRGKLLRQNILFTLCGLGSRMIGRRWSYLRFDVLEAYRRRRRLAARAQSKL